MPIADDRPTACSHSLAPSKLADPQQQLLSMRRQQWVRCLAQSGSSIVVRGECWNCRSQELSLPGAKIEKCLGTFSRLVVRLTFEAFQLLLLHIENDVQYRTTYIPFIVADYLRWLRVLFSAWLRAKVPVTVRGLPAERFQSWCGMHCSMIGYFRPK